MSSTGKRQRDRQFSGARVMHTGCIAQDHAIRHVRQEVLHPGCQGLDDLQLLHLCDSIENLLAFQVGQHEKLDIRDRIRPAVTVTAIDVDVDAFRNSTQSLLRLLDGGVGQPSTSSLFRHGVQCLAVGASVGRRTGKPAASSAALTSAIRSVPKWKTVAASTASAPAAIAGGKSSARPAPPEAINGTSTTARTALIISRSNPSVVPSASIELSRISPTPRSTPRRAHSTASSPAAV